MTYAAQVTASLHSVAESSSYFLKAGRVSVAPDLRALHQRATNLLVQLLTY
jgi:hypothetical protein